MRIFADMVVGKEKIFNFEAQKVLLNLKIKPKERMKKRKSLMAVCLLLGTACHAQGDATVIVNAASGKKMYTTGEVKTITFDRNTMNVRKARGMQTDAFPLADVENIVFSLPTGISGVKTDDGQLTVSSPAGSNMIHIAGYDEAKRYTLSVYAVDGKMVVRQDNWRGEPISVACLPKGVYVLKINGMSVKFKK